MKIKLIIMLIVNIILLSSCSPDTTAIENKNSELYAEVESLKAENELLKQQSNETEITTTFKPKINSEKSVVTTEKEMSEEDVKSIISLSSVKITNINSADGVDIAFYWRNNTNKQIKYITFDIIVYNAVKDIIYDEISSKGIFECKLTGPVEPIAERIEKAKTNLSESLFLYYNNNSVMLDDNLGLCYLGDVDFDTGTWIRYAVPETDYDKIMLETKFETVLYNADARKVRIHSIEIEYMDGSNVNLNAYEASLAYVD